MMEATEREEDGAGASSGERSFGWLFAGLSGAVAADRLWHGDPAGWWFCGGACLLAVTVLAAPSLLVPVARLWLGLGRSLHRVVEPAVMGLIFFLVVTPFGVAARWLGKDGLRLRRLSHPRTHWQDRAPDDSRRGGFRDQF